MDPVFILTSSLTAIGIFFILSSIVIGGRMKENLPLLLRGKWSLLVRLMWLFLGGYLLFLILLWSPFPYPLEVIAALIFFGGALFVFLVISFAGGAVRKIREGEEKIRRHSEATVKELFEIMDEVLANRDQYTFEHAMQVANISKHIGRELGLDEDDLKALELGCLVHDIGKTAIPDDVLLKPGRFDRRDRHIMQYHPLVGAKLFARHLRDNRITDIILNHHERLDGSGYPAGLEGEEIPLLARIVAVADTYEALVSRRPYKPPMKQERVMEIIDEEAEAGKLDTRIVAVLKKIIPVIPPLEVKRSITAGFMQDIELFRQRTYFREPMSDFYNYRFLHFLNDARVLRNSSLRYDLMLVYIPAFGEFQQRIGHIVADQVLDELGQRLMKTCTAFSSSREQYEGSVMLFRKGKDYLIYSEFEGEGHLTALLREINGNLEQVKTEWGLATSLLRESFAAGFPLDEALPTLFGGQTAFPAGENLQRSAYSVGK